MEENSKQKWELVVEVYQPEEARLIIGLLESAGIPVQLERETAGEVFGLNVGPLARIGILIPEARAPEARRILETNPNMDY